MTACILSLVFDPLTSIDIVEVFKKCFLCTTCTVMSVEGPNIQGHALEHDQYSKFQDINLESGCGNYVY